MLVAQNVISLTRPNKWSLLWFLFFFCTWRLDVVCASPLWERYIVPAGFCMFPATSYVVGLEDRPHRNPNKPEQKNVDLSPQKKKSAHKTSHSANQRYCYISVLREQNSIYIHQRWSRGVVARICADSNPAQKSCSYPINLQKHIKIPSISQFLYISHDIHVNTYHTNGIHIDMAKAQDKKRQWPLCLTPLGIPTEWNLQNLRGAIGAQCMVYQAFFNSGGNKETTWI